MTNRIIIKTVWTDKSRTSTDNIELLTHQQREHMRCSGGNKYLNYYANWQRYLAKLNGDKVGPSFDEYKASRETGRSK